MAADGRRPAGADRRSALPFRDRHRAARPSCWSSWLLVLLIAAIGGRLVGSGGRGRRVAAGQLVLRRAAAHVHDRRAREHRRPGRVRRRRGHGRLAGRRCVAASRSRRARAGSRPRRWLARRPGSPPTPTRCRGWSSSCARRSSSTAFASPSGDERGTDRRPARRRCAVAARRPAVFAIGCRRLEGGPEPTTARAVRPAAVGRRPATAARARRSARRRARQAGSSPARPPRRRARRRRRGAHRAAARRVARPAHAARVDQGDGLGPARSDVDWTDDQLAEALVDHRRGDRPPQPPGRQPARRQPAADRRAGGRTSPTDDLAEAVAAALDSVGPARRTRSMSTCPTDLPLVQCDPALLERSLANVVTNAVRHSRPRQPVRVDAGARRRRGARARRRPRPRHSAGRSRPSDRAVPAPRRSTDGDGVGLGLSIAQGFVDAMRRHVDARRHARRRPDRDDRVARGFADRRPAPSATA